MNKKDFVVLLPDDAGIVKSVSIPKDTSTSYTIGDCRETLFNVTERIKAKIREQYKITSVNSVKKLDEYTLKALIGIFDRCTGLQKLIDDDDILNLPAKTVEKIYSMAFFSLFLGRTEQLLELMPILSKEDLLRQVLANQNTAAVRDEEILTTIEDKNKHRQERWATVPKCIDAAIEAITLDRNTGFDRAKPPERETWRTNVQNTLRRTEKRVYKTTEGDYYQTADIAEAMKKHHPEGFEAYQYNNEFTRFAITGEDVQKKQIKTSKKSQKSESR